MIKLSRLLQAGLILMFFLPFFPKGCEYPSKEELEAQRIGDSIRVADSIKLIDSLKLINPLINIDSAYKASQTNHLYNDSIKRADNIVADSAQKIKDTTVIAPTKESDDPDDISTKLSKKSKILKLLLRPNENYTGLAYVINTFLQIINYAGITIAFILWIIGLVLKFRGNSIYHIINIFGLISFYFIGYVYTFTCIDIKLWGYWVTFVFGSIMIIFDSYLLIKTKKK
jgi:hypothetical protein